MDITLERILSLIPRKPDGKFVHGAVKDFATGLGLKSGNIISDWIAGRSASYNGYLYQISERCNVSVEWLKGESEQKEKPTPEGELDMDAVNELLSRLSIADLLALNGRTAVEIARRAQNEENI